ncbi:hypothetical protein DFH06DRAFT_1298246, partial [Mycena polygramma]
MVGTTVFGMLAMAATRFVAASPALITLGAPLRVFPPSDTLSAKILGADAQNRTTYGIYEHKVMSQGTQVFAATLVQGTDHAKYTLSLGTATVGYDCALSAGNAICSSLNADSQPVTSTEGLTSGLVLNVVSVTAAPSQRSSCAGGRHRLPIGSSAEPGAHSCHIPPETGGLLTAVRSENLYLMPLGRERAAGRINFDQTMLKLVAVLPNCNEVDSAAHQRFSFALVMSGIAYRAHGGENETVNPPSIIPLNTDPNAMVGSTVFAMLALIATQFVAASPVLITLDALSILSGTHSATILGVDSQSRTTYAINQDMVDVANSSSTVHYEATLVQGADHAKFTLGPLSEGGWGYDCNLTAGNAICSEPADSMT